MPASALVARSVAAVVMVAVYVAPTERVVAGVKTAVRAPTW